MLNRSTDAYQDVVIEIPRAVSSAEASVTSQSSSRTAVEVTPQGRYATVSSVGPRSVVTVVMSY